MNYYTFMLIILVYLCTTQIAYSQEDTKNSYQETPKIDSNNIKKNSLAKEKPKNICEIGFDKENWQEGIVWVKIGVNSEGEVISAHAQHKTKHGITTITNKNQWEAAEKCAKNKTYPKAPSKSNDIAYGSLPIYFRH